MNKEKCVFCGEYMGNSNNKRGYYFIHKKCLRELDKIGEEAYKEAFEKYGVEE